MITWCYRFVKSNINILIYVYHIHYVIYDYVYAYIYECVQGSKAYPEDTHPTDHVPRTMPSRSAGFVVFSDAYEDTFDHAIPPISSTGMIVESEEKGKEDIDPSSQQGEVSYSYQKQYFDKEEDEEDDEYPEDFDREYMQYYASETYPTGRFDGGSSEAVEDISEKPDEDLIMQRERELFAPGAQVQHREVLKERHQPSHIQPIRQVYEDVFHLDQEDIEERSQGLLVDMGDDEEEEEEYYDDGMEDMEDMEDMDDVDDAVDEEIEEELKTGVLAPGIIDIDAHDHDNPMFVTEYAEDIFSHLRGREAEFMCRPDYMQNFQTDVSPTMRSILMDWLNEVSQEFRYALSLPSVEY
jgi:hypothetical protein